MALEKDVSVRNVQAEIPADHELAIRSSEARIQTLPTGAM
jgi:hypothetical protein